MKAGVAGKRYTRLWFPPLSVSTSLSQKILQSFSLNSFLGKVMFWCSLRHGNIEAVMQDFFIAVCHCYSGIEKHLQDSLHVNEKSTNVCFPVLPYNLHAAISKVQLKADSFRKYDLCYSAHSCLSLFVLIYYQSFAVEVTLCIVNISHNIACKRLSNRIRIKGSE